MPSGTHEGVRLLFEERPELVRELLSMVGVELPAGELVEDASSWSDLSPATYAADLVLQLRVGRATLHSVILEIQNGIDPDKPFVWPRYVATQHARRRCETMLVVIATTELVADWARRPIDTFQPGSGFAPLVIGPREVPRVTDVRAARAMPELAVLSAVVHGSTDDGSIAATTIEAVRMLDSERRRLYMDLSVGSLGAIARAAVEAIMRDRGYEPLTEIGREMLHKGRAEGRSEGRAEGRIETVRAVCIASGVPWTEAHAAAVARMCEEEIEVLVRALVRDRAWPSH